VSFIAETSLVIPHPPEKVYERLADVGSWRRYMPADFRPLGDPQGTLKLGTRLKVKLLHLPVPTPLEVYLANPPTELGWSGGNHKVLGAWHRFVFEPVEPNVDLRSNNGAHTRVRSLETWEGVLSFAVRPVLQPLAVKIANSQLAALARSFD
jgi:hypothetical protein